MFNVETASISELKAKYYDCLVLEQRLKNDMRVLVETINKKEQEAPAPNESTMSVVKD